MKNIKQNIKKAIKAYEKEYKRKLSLDAMWEDWYELSKYLDPNEISVEFPQLDEGHGAITICSYYIPTLKYPIILDWEVSSQYEDENDLIDSIARLEEKGIEIENSLKPIPPEIRDDISVLTDYSYDNEHKHWQECNHSDKKTHIFNQIKRIKKWLNTK